MSSDNPSSNRRIAKHTMMLYIRMVFVLLVKLYVSRVVLKALGVEDYGLYSVVGSVVTFLGFINTSMAEASHRFLAYAKGMLYFGEFSFYDWAGLRPFGDNWDAKLGELVDLPSCR